MNNEIIEIAAKIVTVLCIVAVFFSDKIYELIIGGKEAENNKTKKQ